jgi:hypothetical protein
VRPPLYFSHAACLGHDTGEHPESASRLQAIEAELERRGWLGYERREASFRGGDNAPFAATRGFRPQVCEIQR